MYRIHQSHLALSLEQYLYFNLKLKNYMATLCVKQWDIGDISVPKFISQHNSARGN